MAQLPQGALPPTPRRSRPPYVREKTFLEASRCVRLEQQPRASAEKSCEGGSGVHWPSCLAVLNPPPHPGDFLSPTHNAPHRIQGCLSACKIQD